MIVYRYERIDKWAKARPEEPLVPRWSLDGIFSIARDKEAIFALPEALPSSWINNPDFPDAWKNLKRHMGKMLVEITLNSLDQVKVVDQAHIYRPDTAEIRTIEEIKRGQEKYWTTGVALDEYLADPSKFSLPEIIILNSISRERVKISTQQPLIEETIQEAAESGDDFWSIKLLKQLRMGVPEIKQWIVPCEATLRTQGPSKEIL